MNATALPPIPSDTVSLTVAPLLGIMFNWYLYGALIVQLYLYTQCFDSDRLWIKCTVYGLFILETVQTALCTHDGMKWFAGGFGDVSVLNKPEFSTIDNPVLDAVIAIIVQLTLCWRIWVLSESWMLSGGISLVAVAPLVGAVASSIRITEVQDLSKLSTVTYWIALWMGGSALVDALIAAAMITLLVRSNSGVQDSENMARIFIKLTIETNSATAIVATIGFVLSLTNPHDNYKMVVAYILGKLYTNTLLVVFNNRHFLGRNRNPGQEISTVIQFQQPFGTTQTSTVLDPPNQFGTDVQKETWIHHDNDLEDQTKETRPDQAVT